MLGSMATDASATQTLDSEEAHISSNTQIQALKHQIEQLQAALDQATALFQKSPGIAFLLNAHGRILDLNMQAVYLLQASPQELIGRNLSLILEPSSQASFASMLKKVFREGTQQTSEIRLLTLQGRTLEMTAQASLHSKDGEASYCHLVLTDITQFTSSHRVLLDRQVSQETHIQEQGLKIRQIHEEFENALRLSAKALGDSFNQVKDSFSLSRIHPEVPDYVKDTENAFQKTQNLLESLETYIKIRFINFQMRSVNLNDVLKKIIRDLKPQLEDRDVQITADSLPILQGDSRVFYIILNEYITNALKFTRIRQTTRIHILVKEMEAEYFIGVEDNGIGFNQRHKSKIFQLFGRIHSEPLYEGTGLGLAVVRRLCERFKGRAWSEGKIDEGSTFWFAWPKSSTKSGNTRI